MVLKLQSYQGVKLPIYYPVQTYVPKYTLHLNGKISSNKVKINIWKPLLLMLFIISSQNKGFLAKVKDREMTSGFWFCFLESLDVACINALQKQYEVSL